MKIAKVRIENLRGFADQTIILNDFTCLVGPNGAGKSTVLCALCLFFRDNEHSATDLHFLQSEDFHRLNTSDPIRITVTFAGVSTEAQQDFVEYYRNGELTITAEAKFDPETGHAEVLHYGQRMSMRKFAPYFEAEESKQPVATLKTIYKSLRETFRDLPDETVKASMSSALHSYEKSHPDLCVATLAVDQFYGYSSGTNKLAKYVQWVYIPAVKDASSEQTETKSSALGKLLARSVRSRVNFTEQLKGIRDRAAAEYTQLIERNQSALNDLSRSLEARLKEYAHEEARIQVKWQDATDKAIRIEEPLACIVAGEEGFQGELSRFGHGLQRCYLLALLQELTANNSVAGPYLILGCDEPELHQHPPQARHLGAVLTKLSESNAQVLVSTHSPHLVAGDRFADIRLVRKDSSSGRATVSSVTVDALALTIGEAKQEVPAPHNAATLKLRQALQPSLNELFFTRVVILVEGLEDIAHILTYAQHLGLLDRLNMLGCHLIAVEGKSRMLHPLAITKHLGIPTFVVFDADSGESNSGNRNKHILDNSAILRIRGHSTDTPMPATTFWSRDTVMWSKDIATTVQEELGAKTGRILERTRVVYGQHGGLEKSTAFISDYITVAWEEGLRSSSLNKLIHSIIDFAKKPRLSEDC